MSKVKTLPFIIQLPLYVNKVQEKTLLGRLEATHAVLQRWHRIVQPSSFSLNQRQNQSWPCGDVPFGNVGSKGQAVKAHGVVGDGTTCLVDAGKATAHEPKPLPFGLGSSQREIRV